MKDAFQTLTSTLKELVPQEVAKLTNDAPEQYQDLMQRCKKQIETMDTLGFFSYNNTEKKNNRGSRVPGFLYLLANHIPAVPVLFDGKIAGFVAMLVYTRNEESWFFPSDAIMRPLLPVDQLIDMFMESPTVRKINALVYEVQKTERGLEVYVKDYEFENERDELLVH